MRGGISLTRCCFVAASFGVLFFIQYVCGFFHFCITVVLKQCSLVDVHAELETVLTTRPGCQFLQS